MRRNNGLIEWPNFQAVNLAWMQQDLLDLHTSSAMLAHVASVHFSVCLVATLRNSYLTLNNQRSEA